MNGPPTFSLLGSRRSALIVGVAVAMLAGIVLSGWLAGVPVLVRVLPGAAPMRFNAAVLLLLTGIGLVAIALQRRWIPRALGAWVVLFATATLSQDLLGLDLGIDNLLLRDWSETGPNPSGRMAVNSALCFILLGSSLVSLSLSGRSHWQPLGECLCGSAVLAVGTMAAFGYASGIDAAYGWFGNAGMAIHTALAFAVCGAAIVGLALPNERPWSAGGPAWLPLPISLALCTAALVMWQALRLEHQAHASRLPEIVLIAGLAFALMAGLLIHYVQQARFRLRSAEQATAALLTSEIKFRAIFDQTFQFIGLLSPEGTVLAGNRTALAFVGLAEADVLGQPFWETPWWTHSPVQQQLLRDAITRAAGGELVRMETTHVALDGSTCYIDFSLKPVRDEQGRVSMLIPEGRDITDRKRAEEQLARAARLDKLTGLPNRSLLLDRLQQTMFRARRSGKFHYAALFLDFDRFKLINDSLGHDAGDALLREIAQRLQDHVRAVDSVSRSASGNTTARLGGDEFVVLLDELQSPGDVLVVAERLLAAFAQPYQLGNHEVFSTASIGIVAGDAHYERAEDVLRDADTAMYEAKRAGRARYMVFDASMRHRVQRRLQLEGDLRKATHEGQLSLVYQPIVSLSTGEFVSVEALLRWQHPIEGAIGPDEFIPIAEESNLILDLGDWVLSRACQQMTNWIQQLGLAAPATVSVNLSHKQLASPDLLVRLRRVLAESGLEPQRLQLEVSEESLTKNQAACVQTMEQIRALGVQLAIDDFGTGCLSFTAVHRFPVEMLKVDGSLLNGIEESQDAAALLHALAVLVKNLGMCLVAEGVETTGQAVALRELGCNHAQGYFFTGPVPASEFEQFISRSVGTRHEATGAMAFANRWADHLSLESLE